MRRRPLHTSRTARVDDFRISMKAAPWPQYKSSRRDFCLHQEVGISSLPGVTMIENTTIPERPAGPRLAWPLALLAALLVAGAAIGLYLTRFHENALYGDSSIELANCPQDETTN